MSGFDFSKLFMHDSPELEAINKEIRQLQLKRRQIISDKLLGRTRTNIGGMEFVTDPTCPPDVIELRDSRSGEVLARLKTD